MSKLPKLSALAIEDSGWGYFLCTYKEIRTGRSGGEFLFLSLQDASAQVVAKLMTDVDRFKGEFEAGEFVRVEGRGSLYNGQIQLVLSTIRRVNPDQDRLQGFREEDCILSAPRPIDEMWEELQGHLRGVKNDHIRILLNRIVTDHEAQLRIWPAAQQIHHAYRGGFLEHIAKMAEVGRLIARAYGADEDLVLAGVVLHDIGKLQELAYEGGAGSYTRDGNLVGHIALGMMMVREAAQRHLRISRRAALADRTPGRLAPRHPRIRIAGRAEDDRSVHPRLGRRARREAESSPQGDQGRSFRRRVHQLE